MMHFCFSAIHSGSGEISSGGRSWTGADEQILSRSPGKSLRLTSWTGTTRWQSNSAVIWVSVNIFFFFLTIYNTKGVRWYDNLFLFLFRYQENKLRVQRGVAIALKRKGNVKEASGIVVSDSPLKKRKRNWIFQVSLWQFRQLCWESFRFNSFLKAFVRFSATFLDL